MIKKKNTCSLSLTEKRIVVPLGQWISNFFMVENLLENLFKHRLLDHIPSESQKFTGGTDKAGSRSHFENYCIGD